ncbi:AraC family transcriptional regulator [Clostridium fungisolvens]|uniref:HTH-type transcriptional activator RhaS n=1 Tax=Clostridium fungisolvens TaxID=1604897 RepID=A0A6V8SF51_9CLOT|nr:AraC family transcriptional regulator [Clostridium fungisolvens]GFP75222.1 HTH-type transcriptional activator RhaS [Clostridium fungisolvens]
MENEKLNKLNELFEDKLKQLANLIERFTDKEGLQSSSIPSLDFIRSTEKSELLHSIYTPSLCVIVQGAKMVILGSEGYRYDKNSYLVASVHLPITGQIIEASSDAPYLSLRLGFSSDQILDIIKETKQATMTKQNPPRGLIVNKTSLSLLDALLRLVSLLETPADIPVLAPLFIREILYRILQDDQGDVVKQFAMIGSHAQAISSAINLINKDFSKSLSIEELAKTINMSPSSLHHHFKKVTAMSPLQYQKQVRLQEARRLLLSETLEAADAAFQVGYESPSQFSREYSRMFGLPPISDIKRLKNSIYVNF